MQDEVAAQPAQPSSHEPEPEPLPVSGPSGPASGMQPGFALRFRRIAHSIRQVNLKPVGQLHRCPYDHL